MVPSTREEAILGMAIITGVYASNPPIDPEDVPVMDSGEMAPLFDTQDE